MPSKETKMVKELEKTQTARLFSVLGFAPAMLYFATQTNLSKNQKNFLYIASALTAVTVGYAYYVNDKRLSGIDIPYPDTKLHETVERSEAELKSSQNIRLYADLMVFVPFLAYVAHKGTLNNIDKVVFSAIGLTTMYYNVNNYIKNSNN